MNRVLGLCRADGYLAKDPSKVRGMFSSHFENIFPLYALTNVVMATRDACCRVVPCKVSSGDRDWLDRDFFREEIYATLTSMQNGKLLGMNGLPCKFYMAMWYTIGHDFHCLDL